MRGFLGYINSIGYILMVVRYRYSEASIKGAIVLLSFIGLIFVSSLHGTMGQTQGDANIDGNITSADITCVILGIFEMPCPMPDCNEDESVTSADIMCVVLQYFQNLHLHLLLKL